MLTVTRLEPQKKNPGRMNVYLDGEFAFGISMAVAPWLKEGEQISQHKVTALQTKDELERAYQRALNFLSYRTRSKQEIRQNLQKAKVTDEIIDSVLDKLGAVSLVNDTEFAREWVENRIKFRPRGKRALSSELFQKGISNQIIEETLQEINEEQLAFNLARKKMAKHKHLEKSEFQKKLYGYLSRSGFNYSLSKEVINNIWIELEEQS